jgi:hypothetical protein
MRAERAMAAVAVAALASPVVEAVAHRLDRSPNFCPLLAVTGTPCPSCGATRAALHLLSGDLPSALVMNPGATLFTVAIGLGALVGAWTVAGFFGVAKPENTVADSSVMTNATPVRRILVTA